MDKTQVGWRWCLNLKRDPTKKEVHREKKRVDLENSVEKKGAKKRTGKNFGNIGEMVW